MRVGDCNNDNVISILDFNILKSTYGMGIGDPGYDDRADFTGDQVVTILDFNLLKVNFGQSGAPPILLVGGTNDPATPYAEAQSVNRQIQGSVLLTRQGNGHTSYDSSACAHAAEDAYLINLTLPAAGATCSS